MRVMAQGSAPWKAHNQHSLLADVYHWIAINTEHWTHPLGFQMSFRFPHFQHLNVVRLTQYPEIFKGNRNSKTLFQTIKSIGYGSIFDILKWTKAALSQRQKTAINAMMEADVCLSRTPGCFPPSCSLHILICSCLIVHSQAFQLSRISILSHI